MSNDGSGENKDDFYDKESVVLSFVGSEADFAERSLNDIRFDNYRMQLKIQTNEILESVMKLRIKLENIEAKLKKYLDKIHNQMNDDFDQKQNKEDFYFLYDNSIKANIEKITKYIHSAREADSSNWKYIQSIFPAFTMNYEYDRITFLIPDKVEENTEEILSQNQMFPALSNNKNLKIHHKIT